MWYNSLKPNPLPAGKTRLKLNRVDYMITYNIVCPKIILNSFILTQIHQKPKIRSVYIQFEEDRTLRFLMTFRIFIPSSIHLFFYTSNRIFSVFNSDRQSKSECKISLRSVNIDELDFDHNNTIFKSTLKYILCPDFFFCVYNWNIFKYCCLLAPYIER